MSEWYVGLLLLIGGIGFVAYRRFIRRNAAKDFGRVSDQWLAEQRSTARSATQGSS
jgi:hypothetical protein